MTAQRTSEFQLPISPAFYRELAAIAWASLSESQQDQIRQFLVLRFIDSKTDALDDCTHGQIRERFNLLLKSGSFDQTIDSVLLTKVNMAKLVAQTADRSIDELQNNLRAYLDQRWKTWLTEPDGYSQRVKDAVDTALASESVEKLITAALYRHLQKNDIKGKVDSMTANRIQALLDDWEKKHKGRSHPEEG